MKKDPHLRESINTTGEPEAEKQHVSKFGPKKYRYAQIKLNLDEERTKLLKDCCGYCGIDPSRVDDHQQDVVWELLRWMRPALEIRAWVEATFGKVMMYRPK